MDFKRVKISTTVPVENADQLRHALGGAGAGNIGEANKLEVVEEGQIEVVCDRTIAKKVIAALKTAHPYEEVIVDVTPLINEEAP